MIIYQLAVKGRTAFLEDSSVIYSKKVFYREEEAEWYMDEFKILCSTPLHDKDTKYFETITEVHILELNLE